MKISALMLLVWYCISIIGFDVHTCRESGRSFVASSILGTECEDIHADHHHDHCCSDCEHHASSEADCVSHEDCCTDDIQVLVLTGSNTNDGHRHYDECHCGLCPCVVDFLCGRIHDLYAQCDIHEKFHIPDSGLIAVEEVQSFLSIWRI